MSTPETQLKSQYSVLRRILTLARPADPGNLASACSCPCRSDRGRREYQCNTPLCRPERGGETIGARRLHHGFESVLFSP